MSGERVTRAVRLTAVGQPLRLAEVVLPEPGDGEVLVELDHAGVNPIDTYAAAGTIGDVSRLPRTIGVEGTGVIAGTATRVVISAAGTGLSRDGTWAGAIVVPRTGLVEVPATVDPAQAGAIGTAAVTAYDALHVVGQLRSGDRVLVLGAGGGVGSVAVQLAKAAGASVLGQVGSAAKADFVAGLGADRVVVATAERLVAEAGSFEPTLVVDPLGGGFTPAVIELAAPGGRIVLLGVSAGPDITFGGRVFYRKALSLLGYTGLWVTQEQRVTAVQAIAAELVAGTLRIPVDEIVPLAEFEAAVARLRDRSVTGKVVLATQG
jgi:NADPH2:quinone reductase